MYVYLLDIQIASWKNFARSNCDRGRGTFPAQLVSPWFLSHENPISRTERDWISDTRLHDTTGWQPVVQPVWQQVVSCKRGFSQRAVNCWDETKERPSSNDTRLDRSEFWTTERHHCLRVFRTPTGLL